VTDRLPATMTGSEIRLQIDGLVANTEGSFVGYGEQHMWTHKSGLTWLPYYDNLLLPHNIDVMHTERMLSRHFGTIMDIPDKSKDNIKVRVDLAALCDRPNQEMKPPRGGKTWRRPKADFVLRRA
jgi:ethanolamine utilization protein EutQ (cupin superfamily)